MSESIKLLDRSEGRGRVHEWKNRKGHLHRISGPACLFYRKDAAYDIYPEDEEFWLFQEHWYRNGLLHRNNKPAFIEYHSDGQPRKTSYYYLGSLHRTDGEAWWSTSNKIPAFYLYGVHLAASEHKSLLQLPRLDMLVELAKRAPDKSFIAKLIEPIDPIISRNILASNVL